MVIKGNSRGKPSNLAAHLSREDTNEAVRILGSNGIANDQSIRGAIKEMHAVGRAMNTSQRNLYHASINAEADTTMSPDRWEKAADVLERRLGLEGHQRLIVLHVKEGREHIHIVWNRVNDQTMKLASDSQNFARHEAAAREIEHDLGHRLTIGKHNKAAYAIFEKEGREDLTRWMDSGGAREAPAPIAAKSHADHQREERTKIPTAEVTRDISEVWRLTETGAELKDELARLGYTLAKGDKRDAVILDPAGDAHSLPRRAGVKAKEARERLEGLDLPTLDQAREQVRKKGEQEREGLEARVRLSDLTEKAIARLAEAQEAKQATLEELLSRQRQRLEDNLKSQHLQEERRLKEELFRQREEALAQSEKALGFFQRRAEEADDDKRTAREARVHSERDLIDSQRLRELAERQDNERQRVQESLVQSEAEQREGLRLEFEDQLANELQARVKEEETFIIAEDGPLPRATERMIPRQEGKETSRGTAGRGRVEEARQRHRHERFRAEDRRKAREELLKRKAEEKAGQSVSDQIRAILAEKNRQDAKEQRELEARQAREMRAERRADDQGQRGREEMGRQRERPRTRPQGPEFGP